MCHVWAANHVGERNATHSRNRVVRKLAKALGVDHRFSVANSAWTNGTVERMMREVIHGAKAMLNEGGRPLSEWVVVLPAAQWTLNMAWRKRLHATPYHVMTGRKPRTAFTALIEGDDEGFQFSPIDEARLQQLVVSLLDTQEGLLAGVLQRVDADHRHHRSRGSRGNTLPHFTVGSYVLVARVSRQGKHRKLMSIWSGPGRVANDDKEHVYAVQHLATSELRNVHVARMRFYADDQFEITGELLKLSQQLENEGEYHVPSISAIKRTASGDEFVAKGAWEGLEEVESTWEPVSRLFRDAPAMLRKELKALRIKAEHSRALVQRYGLSL